ncbi:MAG: trypsin-like peptidase domain-containing protein [Bdellovibrionales bacterium]|nr:trypsin-like peptidase domain-containing protein [Bdellovibrionales bacterium]
MLKNILLVGTLGLLVACQDAGVTTSALNGERVIYGDDDRLDLYQVEDQKVMDNARSTVALVQMSKIRSAGEGVFNLAVTPLADRMNLCPTERFKEQNTLAFCSGSLVGPDLVLTAGHCARNCDTTAMIFDYAVNSASENPSQVKEDNLYLCKEVVDFKLEQGFGADYALLRLDRPVANRTPLKIRRSGNVSKGTKLYVIGHPSGLPTKVAGGASVREIDHRPYFVANLDTYGGNSGSAVFNQETGEIEGILVRGETDYVSNGVCMESMRCDNDDCMGEHVTKVGLVGNSIPKSEESDVISSLNFE